MIETTRTFASTDRYIYDFEILTYGKGWAQVDTKQDASYFGTWTNPTTLEIFTYCEGDITRTKCETAEEYKAELSRVVDWNKEAGYWLGIDPGFSPEMRERFVGLGLESLLH